jgi:hypothetical protein
LNRRCRLSPPAPQHSHRAPDRDHATDCWLGNDRHVRGVLAARREHIDVRAWGSACRTLIARDVFAIKIRNVEVTVRSEDGVDWLGEMGCSEGCERGSVVAINDIVVEVARVQPAIWSKRQPIGMKSRSRST